MLCITYVNGDKVVRQVPQMVWHDQDPLAIDVPLDINMPFSSGGSPAYLELDKLPDGRYRATVGTMFEFHELCRTSDLEGLIRCVRRVQLSQSFDEMVSAIRAMRGLDESGNSCRKAASQRLDSSLLVGRFSCGVWREMVLVKPK